MSSTKTGIYDFSEVVLLIKHQMYGGIIKIDGFMEGSEITVARNNPRWENKGSGDGKATTLVRSPDNSGSITFTLNQSTDSLDKMNAICQYANTTKNLTILSEVTLVDKSSRSIFFSPDSIASSPENVSFGVSESGREYKLLCGELQETLGGSSKIPADTLSFLGAFGIEVDDSWKVSI